MVVSVEQLTALIEFMECHKEVALGHLNRSKEGRSQIKRLWEECAGILNSVSADCVHKTADQWRLYFNEYKSKLLKKIKMEKAEIGATGGGPSKHIKLTPLQERLYNILGRDVGEPLLGVRHNPLSQDNVSEVEVVDDAMALIRPPSVQLAEMDHEEVVVTERPATSRQQCHSTASTSRELASNSIASTSRELPPVATPDPIREATPAQPRRRRRRRRSQVSQPNQATENEPALRAATEHLEAMERLSAEATRELAKATNRQAAAFESMVEVLRQLVNQSVSGSSRQRLKRIRVIYDSDSDSD